MSEFNIDKLVYDKLDALRSRIAANIKTSNQYASGSMSQSLTIESKPNQWSLLAAKFFAVLQTGRKPGKMPPISNILNWIKSRSIQLEGKSNLSMAWGIAKWIAKHGTRLFQSGGRKDIYTNEIKTFKKNLFSDIRIKLSVYIKQTIQDANSK